MQRAKGLILYIIFIFLGSCGGERANDPVVATPQSLTVTLEQAIDFSVIRAVDNFYSESNLLSSEANEFCALQDEESLLTLQDRWKALMLSWYRLASYNFGPLNDDFVFPVYTFIDSLRLRGTDYTETLRLEIATNLSETHTLDEPFFSGRTFQRVGLLALELMIFETSSSAHSREQSEIVAEYQTVLRKCDLLLGFAGQIEKHATYIYEGWNVSFKGRSSSYKTLFLDSQLDDGSLPLTQLLVAVQEYLDYLRSRDVVNLTAQISSYQWESLQASISEVEQLLEGTEKTTFSFFSIMSATGNEDAVSLVRSNIATAHTAIKDKDSALLAMALGLLDGNFKREIPDSLDVDIGFNFTDGD